MLPLGASKKSACSIVGSTPFITEKKSTPPPIKIIQTGAHTHSYEDIEAENVIDWVTGSCLWVFGF